MFPQFKHLFAVPATQTLPTPVYIEGDCLLPGIPVS